MTEETTDNVELLTRDAHLSELTVNRFLAGELDEEETAAVEQHVVGCSDCNDRIEAVRAFDASFAIAAPAAPVPTPVAADDEEPTSHVVSLDDKRPKGAWIGVVVAAAAAIALVFVVRGDTSQPVTPDADDGIRIKGGDLALEVFAKTRDAKPRRVGKGDVVHPGDRLGFKVTSRQPGFAMVVGIDDAGQVYAGWPQGAGVQAKFLEAQDRPRELEAAIVLDDVGSSETLVLVRCAEAFDVDAAARQLKARTSLDAKPPRDPMEGCVYDEIPLKKQPR